MEGHQDIWKIARPRKPVKARIRRLGEMLVIVLDDGAEAVIPKSELCRLIERYNLVVEGVKC